MQIPLEVVLGPVGALGVALLWILDLRKQRDDYQAKLNKLVDELVAGIRKADVR